MSNADFRTRLYQLEKEGVARHDIATTLNKEGFQSPRGSKFNKSIIQYWATKKRRLPVAATPSYQRLDSSPHEPQGKGLAIAIVGSAEEIARIVKGIMQ